MTLPMVDPTTDDAFLARRLLRLSGTFNARDVGGYVTPAGPVGWGRLLRADSLDALDDESRLLLAELGVRTVVDLRREQERTERPDALAGLDVTTVHVSIMSGALPTELAAAPSLAEVYATMVASSGTALAAAVSALAEPDALPAIVHCTAGKDRTGVVVALVLALVGVDEADIVADYEISGGCLGEAFVLRLTGATAPDPLDAAAVAAMTDLLGSPPELIREVLATMRSTHGGVLEYLLAHGMDPSAPARLREALIVR